MNQSYELIDWVSTLERLLTQVNLWRALPAVPEPADAILEKLDEVTAALIPLVTRQLSEEEDSDALV